MVYNLGDVLVKVNVVNTKVLCRPVNNIPMELILVLKRPVFVDQSFVKIKSFHLF